MLMINRMLRDTDFLARFVGLMLAIVLSVMLSACGSGDSDSSPGPNGGGEVTPEQPSDKKPVQLHCAP